MSAIHVTTVEPIEGSETMVTVVCSCSWRSDPTTRAIAPWVTFVHRRAQSETERCRS